MRNSNEIQKNFTKYNTDKYKRKNIPNNLIGSKVPPNSPEAEMSVLGAMMIDRSAIAKAIEILEPDSFYDEANRIIFDTMLQLFDRRITVDSLTLTEELKKTDNYDSIGGAYYLSQLSDIMPTSANVDHYARIVQEKYLKRMLIQSAGMIMHRAYDESTDAIEELDNSERLIFSIAEKLHSKSYSTMKKLARETYELIESLSKRKSDGLTGVSSGFRKLDELLGGFQKSDLIIVAGRPSMGKTALALSIARNAAVDNKTPIAFFSIEMSAIQLVIRLLSAEGRINQQKIRTGMISEEDNTKIVKALGDLASAPIFIDDSAMMTVMELRAKCRRLKAEHDIQAVFVDYMQLIHSPRAESREREISMISQSLKQMAKELEIPVISLAQLNRSVESRNDKRPMLSDLRESGSIEQDADVVMFVNRPEKNNKMQFEDGTSTEGIAEIIIGKQRNGPIGDFRLAFLKDYARFENLAYGFTEEDAEMAQANSVIDDEDMLELKDINEDPGF